MKTPYSSGIARYYDLFGAGSGQPDEAAAFVQRLAGAPCSVLDIGAGVGNTAFALAARGFEVTALEPDPEMFAVLLARLALRRDLEGTLSPVPRAAGFDLDRRFDICTCFSVLHLLADRAERQRLIAYAAEQLVPGGRLVLELPVHSPQRVRRPITLTAERWFGDVHFQHFSALEQMPDGSWTTVWKFMMSREGEQLDQAFQSFTWRASSLDETQALISGAGLVAEQRQASFDGGPLVEGESRVLVSVARKPA